MKYLCSSIFFELNVIIHELPALIFIDCPELFQKMRLLCESVLQIYFESSEKTNIKLVDDLSQLYENFYKEIPAHIIFSNHIIYRSHRKIRGEIANYQGIFSDSFFKNY